MSIARGASSALTEPSAIASRVPNIAATRAAIAIVPAKFATSRTRENAGSKPRRRRAIAATAYTSLSVSEIVTTRQSGSAGPA